MVIPFPVVILLPSSRGKEEDKEDGDGDCGEDVTQHRPTPPPPPPPPQTSSPAAAAAATAPNILLLLSVGVKFSSLRVTSISFPCRLLASADLEAVDVGTVSVVGDVGPGLKTRVGY